MFLEDYVCPISGCDVRGEEIPETSRTSTGRTHYLKVISNEVSGLYDGVAFWTCQVCGESWHRFPVEDPLHQRVQTWWNTSNTSRKLHVVGG